MGVWVEGNDRVRVHAGESTWGVEGRKETLRRRDNRVERVKKPKGREKGLEGKEDRKQSSVNTIEKSD